MRDFIRPIDVKKEYRNDYFVYTLVSYHNVLASLEHKYDHNGDYSDETEKAIRYVQEEEAYWAMEIENAKDRYQDLKGRLLEDTSLRSVHVSESLDALLRPRRVVRGYAGVEDKNGKSVCAGDIVRTKHGRLYEVVHQVSGSKNFYDMKPFGNLDCPPLDECDMWASENLEVVTDKYPYVEMEEEDK